MLQNQGLSQSAALQKRRKEYRCDVIDPLTGQSCNIPFNRAWNLKRHKLDLHRDRDVFVNYVTTGMQLPGIQALSLPSSLAPMQMPAVTQPSAPPAPPSPLSPPSPSFPPSPQPPRVPAPAFSLSLPEKRTFRSNLRISDHLAQLAGPVASQNSYFATGLEDQFSQSDAIDNRRSSPTGQNSESDNPTSETSEHCLDSVRTLSVGSECPCRKRKRERSGRVVDADLRADIPAYLVKRSKKTLGQQRGLDWLSVEGKAHFESTIETLLAQ